MDRDQARAALADPTRARIVRLIRISDDGRESVTPLAAALGLRQPTVSHHLRELLEAGIVERAKDGRRAWFSVSDDAVPLVDRTLGHRTPHEPDLARVRRDLTERYRGAHAPGTVAHVVDESAELLRATSGEESLLASRVSAFAAQRLDALRDAGAAIRVPSVLFVCVKNAGRSQMAAAILRHLAGDAVAVRTAGSAPASGIAPAIGEALDEIGVPLGAEFPKPLTDESVRASDVVITMGCGDACPVYPGIRYEEWELEDPAMLPLARVRAVRDDIDARVRALLADLRG
ncbi:metalloregulator ArsR/SmtB family transcription factor [Microbacterium karelineae]|uniref:metalloregulator ArsR/SmtB family transcription factor n=1 Tax=Microbacterium karelineae TaxID=2654283 RepID=UPI0012E9F8D9|nr:metalloregulator ArsR/SmtB family transcription factor [Microbacterium karelineae]